MHMVDGKVEALFEQALALRPDQFRVLQRALLHKRPGRTDASVTAKDIADDSPAAKVAIGLIEQAISKNASDIHLDVQKKQVRIRLRIDGILRSGEGFDAALYPAVCAWLKKNANLEIDEQTPQDGHLVIDTKDSSYSLQAAFAPTSTGEKVRLHIVKREQDVPVLEALGLQPTAFKMFSEAIAQPHGLVIIAGTQDSGATTTAYSALLSLNNPAVNIATIEDPITTSLSGISQMQVQPRAGIDFDCGMRVIMRQDPNIIFIGSLRDQPTAQSAINAALSGKMVVAVMPASSASESITQLTKLGGIDPYLIAATLRAAVGQRLVRKLCPECKQQYQPTSDELNDIAAALGLHETWETLLRAAKQSGAITLWRPQTNGCKNCNQTGYTGQIGIFEVLAGRPETQRLILGHADSHTLRAGALEQDMQTDGVIKSLLGKTSIEEVIRCCLDCTVQNP